ncbi:MAG: hypothetical protein DYG97_13710 [Ignavibacteria bacterium CHB3]|nr:hypothetical protein [Ignavibacteria bacterium CHB3]
MNKTVKKIAFILIILILLPAAFLTINEMISLNQNEEVIGKIYSNQLDAILFSVNQYSEDVVENKVQVEKLFLYSQSGYRKLEPVKLGIPKQRGYFLLFIKKTNFGTKQIVGMFIEPQEFTYRILSPKIQEIAQGEFVISVFNNDEKFHLNSAKDPDLQKVQQSKALWIFPDYQIGISLVGQTIEDIGISKRKSSLPRLNLILFRMSLTSSEHRFH